MDNIFVERLADKIVGKLGFVPGPLFAGGKASGLEGWYPSVTACRQAMCGIPNLQTPFDSHMMRFEPSRHIRRP